MTATRFATFADLRTALQKGARIENVAIDAPLAASILDANAINRKVRAGHALKLARQMKLGHWNSELPASRMLLFNDEARLVDGQHRLRAVLLLEGAHTLIADLVPNMRSTVGLDENSGRSVADHLALEGIADAHIAAACTRMLFREFDTEGNAGASDILDYYHAHAPFITECVTLAKTWLQDVPPARAIMRAPELAGVRAIAIAKENLPADRVDEFLSTAMFGGAGPDDQSPAGRFFAFLSTRKERTVSPSRRVQLALEGVSQHISGKARRFDMMKPKRKKRQAKASLLEDDQVKATA